MSDKESTLTPRTAAEHYLRRKLGRRKGFDLDDIEDAETIEEIVQELEECFRDYGERLEKARPEKHIRTEKRLREANEFIGRQLKRECYLRELVTMCLARLRSIRDLMTASNFEKRVAQLRRQVKDS